MKGHWRKIAYAVFWVVLLAVTLESFVHPEADSETRAVMRAIIALFAAPISIVPLFVFSAIGWPFSDGSQTAMENPAKEFLLYCLTMFAISYWQWFHLVPKLKSRFPGTPEA